MAHDARQLERGGYHGGAFEFARRRERGLGSVVGVGTSRGS